jgi:hypothetical protein
MRCRCLMLIGVVLVIIDGSVAHAGFSFQLDGAANNVAIPSGPELGEHCKSQVVKAGVRPSDGPHVAFVLGNDGDVLCSYRGGTVCGSPDTAGNRPDTNAVAWIGGSVPSYSPHYGTDIFFGHVDNVRTWDVAQANKQISCSVPSGRATGCGDGLAPYWNFGEGNVDAYDSSSYASDGYLGSVTWFEDNGSALENGPSPVLPMLSAFLLACAGLIFTRWTSGKARKRLWTVSLRH